jgi:hypothetical protein
MVDYLTPDAVLLVGEDERRRGGCFRVGKGGEARINEAIAGKQLQVLEPKGSVVCGGAGVFAWLQQIVKGANGHVGYFFGCFCSRVCVMVGNGEDGQDELDRDWLDP